MTSTSFSAASGEMTSAILVVLGDGLLVGGDLDHPADLRALIHDAVHRVLDGR